MENALKSGTQERDLQKVQGVNLKEAFRTGIKEVGVIMRHLFESAKAGDYWEPLVNATLNFRFP